MKWIKKNVTIPVVLTAAIALGGLGAAFVRVQVHAADRLVHVDGTNYVPRKELEQVQIGIDDRLDIQDKKLDEIHADVKDIQRLLMER